MRSAEHLARPSRKGSVARIDGLTRAAQAGALLGVLTLCGCATELTEIIVIVDSELAVPGELDEIVVTTEGASGLPKGGSANLVGAGATSMPVTVGLRPGGAHDGPVTIRVRGRHAGAERVSAQVHTRFVAGARLVLRIDLAAECIGIICADEETCRNGFCVPYAVDPAELPRYTGTLPGSVEDAGRDLGPRDAGLDADRDGSLICTSSCSDRQMCCGGACVAAGCGDGNPCTSDSCGSSGCSNVVNAGATCSDGSACTVGDTCSASGSCSPGPAASCDDGNPCTDDSCGSSGCRNTPNSVACNDGSACTLADTCVGGACVGGPAPSCTDGNPCTTDGCNPSTGCVFPAFDGPCNDGDACTTGELCSGGVCGVGTPVTCPASFEECRRAECQPAVGCVDVVVSSGFCDDGDDCTTPDRCTAGGICRGIRRDPCAIEP